MSRSNSFISENSQGEPVFSLGDHEKIPKPVFIPEIKSYEGLYAVLTYTSALDVKNPVMVPSAAYESIRSKTVRRYSENTPEISEQKVETFEKDYPLILLDPPELFNYRKPNALINYYFKGQKKDKEDFESKIRDGDYENALSQLPKCISGFIKANLDKVTNHIEGAPTPHPEYFEVSSTDQAWQELDSEDYMDYYQELMDTRDKLSGVLIPPVPKITRKMADSLTVATCTSNAKMAEICKTDGTPNSYFHVFLDHLALKSDGSGIGRRVLGMIEGEIERKDYAGIALTIRNPHKVDSSGRRARTSTFVSNVVQTAEEHGLPVIAPRSEWLGALFTDNGVAGFSDMMNSGWEYPDGSPGGPEEIRHHYGRLTAYDDAQILRVDPDVGTGAIEYMRNGNLTEFESLPNTPPGDLTNGESYEQVLGTPPEYRRKFSKPRKLSHVYEAKEFREKRSQGVNQPAREYLKHSNNPYIDV